MTMETVITLEPVSTIAANESSSDDWLNNSDAELISASTHEDNGASLTVGERYRVDSIACKTTARGVFLQTETGEVELFSGDHIIVAEQTLRVKITQENTQSTTEPEFTPTQTLNFVSDDIWGSSDERRAPLSHVPDPFQRKTHATLPVTSQQPQAMTNTHSNDSLNFLYQSNTPGHVDPNALLPSVPLTGTDTSSLNNMPNYFNGADETASGMTMASAPHLPSGDANVLNELGITPSATPTILAQEGIKTVLDESPLDRLDEYLNVDEERYQPTASAQTVRPQTSLRDHNAPWLKNVRSLFTSGKKS